MYYTHHFAHRHTLARACTWLTRLGFPTDQMERHVDGPLRLALPVEAGRLAEIGMLINAVERSDPEGWPSFWETAKHVPSQPLLDPEVSVQVEPSTSTRAAIGWHPVD